MDFDLLDASQLLPGTRLLIGSQAKTAFALRLNCAYMVEKYGVNRCGFLTLTVGDWICPTHGKQIPTGRWGQCPCCKKRCPANTILNAPCKSSSISLAKTHSPPRCSAAR